jgi:hypothetical protein
LIGYFTAPISFVENPAHLIWSIARLIRFEDFRLGSSAATEEAPDGTALRKSLYQIRE